MNFRSLREIACKALDQHVILQQLKGLCPHTHMHLKTLLVLRLEHGWAECHLVLGLFGQEAEAVALV